MNMLVDYASESDSEDELAPVPSKKQEPIPPTKGEDGGDGDDDFILAALKDLQDFAASVETTNQQETETVVDNTKGESHRQGSESSVARSAGEDPEDLQLLAFLKEVDAIPFPADEPDLPPPPPPLDSMLDNVPPPPPPPLEPPSEENGVYESTATSSVSQCVHSIHARLQQLFILPAPTLDYKDLERRMLEFAIRIVDWENGGLEPSYFLGEAKANSEAKSSTLSPEAEKTRSTTDMVPYGGIVGSMLKHLHELEQLAAPTGWVSLWDPMDEAYGFQHIRTGAYLSTYPTLDQIHYLDPPILPSSTGKTTRGYYGKSTFISRPVTGTTAASSLSTSSSTPQTTGSHAQWNLSSTSSPTKESPSKDDSATLTSSPPTMSSPTTLSPTTLGASTIAESVTVTPTRKKRKVNDSQFEPQGSMDPSQHMHPSRRALMSTKSAATTTSVSSSKFMPKKLANLLQKWSEKDRETSDDDRDNEEEEEEDASGSGTHGGLGRGQTAYEKSASGANSQALGSDWRERRLQQHNK